MAIDNATNRSPKVDLENGRQKVGFLVIVPSPLTKQNATEVFSPDRLVSSAKRRTFITKAVMVDYGEPVVTENDEAVVDFSVEKVEG